jgi:hypothetical protein
LFFWYILIDFFFLFSFFVRGPKNGLQH